MSEINWDKAPEGATHYNCDSIIARFYRVNGLNAEVYSIVKKRWIKSILYSADNLSGPKFMARPVYGELGRLEITTGEHDEVQNPKHYDLFDGQQAIDFIKASLTPEEFAGYCKGNFLKYRLRAGEKGDPLRCLAKSDWYREYLRGLANE